MKRVIRTVAVLLASMLFTSTVHAEWISDANGRKYVKHDGSCYTNEWFKYGAHPGVEKWYYFGPDGYMVHDQWIEGLYYMDENGEMLVDTVTPDLYYVGKDGKYNNYKNSKGQKVFYKTFDVDGAEISVTVLYPDRLTGPKSGITHVFRDDFGLTYNKLWCGFQYVPGSSNGIYNGRSQTFTISRTINGETTTKTDKFSLKVVEYGGNRETVYIQLDPSGPVSDDGKVHVEYLITIP